MARLAADPVAVRAWAKAIAGNAVAELSDGDRSFLATLAEFDGTPPMSVRQREYLDGLIERTERYPVVDGFRADRLVRLIHEARLDLDEDEEARIADLAAGGAGLALSPRQWRWVLAVSRRLGLIDDPYIALPGRG
ncbi:MAG TPA: hypothetical protein PK264_03475 [Hyphomicrobiaceae bacterium]|nr:hypothetical protein [Hyphomicrobiaceae bacterium]